MTQGERRLADAWSRALIDGEARIASKVGAILAGRPLEFRPMMKVDWQSPIPSTGMRQLGGALRVAQFLEELGGGGVHTASTLETEIELKRPLYDGVLRLLVNLYDIGVSTRRSVLVVAVRLPRRKDRR